MSLRASTQNYAAACIRCDGKPFIEKHKVDGEHECVEQKCEPRKCNPLVKSTVRQIHNVT